MRALIMPLWTEFSSCSSPLLSKFTVYATGYFHERMSTLGHKRTLKRLQPMSALPPKADIRTWPALQCNSSGSLAMFAAIRLASSRSNNFAADLRVAIGGAAVQTIHAQAKPPAYVILEGDVTNVDAYIKEYVPLVRKALLDGGAQYLIDSSPTTAPDPRKARIRSLPEGDSMVTLRSPSTTR